MFASLFPPEGGIWGLGIPQQARFDIKALCLQYHRCGDLCLFLPSEAVFL